MAEPDRWNPILGRLEAAIAHFAATQASKAAKLDVLLLEMDNLLISQHPQSSSSTQAPPTHAPMPMPLPMTIPLPCPALMQQSQALMLVPHLPANSKHHVPHTSSGRRWAPIPWIRKQYPSRRILPLGPLLIPPRHLRRQGQGQGARLTLPPHLLRHY